MHSVVCAFEYSQKLYGAQPTEEEMVRVTSYVRENIMNFMKSLADAAEDFSYVRPAHYMYTDIAIARAFVQSIHILHPTSSS